MFTFGFSENSNENLQDDAISSEKYVWKESKEIHDMDPLVKNLLNKIKISNISLENASIPHINIEELLELLKNTPNLQNNSILKAEQNHSDLLPAVYEGGLKIWECTYDLLNYLQGNSIIFKNKRVLDLGCGSGVVGIYCLHEGATCWFQDYNEEVIKYITIPNVILNQKSIKNCKFFSGDWQSFSMAMQEELKYKDKFDYILTSETIYNTEAYPKLHILFESLLKEDGIVFLAAKSFYFGVGGGISSFQNYLKKHKIFKYTNCWEYSEGVKRAILEITFNKTFQYNL